LNEISASIVLQKEYELMSKTYLSSEESVVFANKQSLYRKPGFIVNFHPMARYAAASVVLVICGIAGWYYWNSGNKNLQPVIVKENKTEQTLKLPDVKTDKAEIWVQRKNAMTESGNKTVIVAEWVKAVDSAILKNEMQKEEDMPIAVIIEKTDVSPEILPVLTAISDTAISNIYQSAPIPVAKKRSLSYRLINGSKAMLANLQLPNVKLVTEKKDGKTIPTVKMSISTYRTDVIATLIE
jgi:hypothetical protein